MRKIPKLRKKITIEVSKDVLDEIDAAAKKEYRTRTSFLVSCAMTQINQSKEEDKRRDSK
jgi:uncharacterized protein (DUF1778 family)